MAGDTFPSHPQADRRLAFGQSIVEKDENLFWTTVGQAVLGSPSGQRRTWSPACARLQSAALRPDAAGADTVGAEPIEVMVQ